LDYMRGNTPASFYAALTEGRGEMPAFRDTLTSDERWDVVFYVWRFSTNAEVLALGQGLYETYCTACHGADGTGQVLGAADLSDLRLVAERAPRDFYLTVTQGKGSMPAWQGRLSQEERWAVIDYLGTFSYDPSLPEDVDVTPGTTATAGEVTCDPAYLSQTNPIAWDDVIPLPQAKRFTTNPARCAMLQTAQARCRIYPTSPLLRHTPRCSTIAGNIFALLPRARKLCPVGKRRLPSRKCGKCSLSLQPWQSNLILLNYH
jgi:mono/diheme cytochrome c family protein